MQDDLAAIEARAASLVATHEKLLEDLIAQRRKHQIPQDVVAERMGVTQPTVAAFERHDGNPTLSTIRRYAMAVDARIEYKIIDDCAAHTPTQFADVITSAGLLSAMTPVLDQTTWKTTDWISPAGTQRVDSHA